MGVIPFGTDRLTDDEFWRIRKIQLGPRARQMLGSPDVCYFPVGQYVQQHLDLEPPMEKANGAGR